MKTFEVTLVIDVPVIWRMQVQADSVEEAEKIAIENPWDSPGRYCHERVVSNGWDGWGSPTLPGFEFDLESTRPVELVPERATVEVEDVAA